MSVDAAKKQVGPSSEKAVDPRVTQTLNNVKQALLDLTKTHDPDKISVSLLCRTAGISRPTFYEHFDGIYAVYDQILGEKMAQLDPEADFFGPPQDVEAARRRVTALIEYIDEHREEFLALVDSQSSVRKVGRVFHDRIQEHLAVHAFGSPLEELPGEQADRVRFMVNGMTGLLVSRVHETGTPQPAAETVDHMYRYLETLRGLP